MSDMRLNRISGLASGGATGVSSTGLRRGAIRPTSSWPGRRWTAIGSAMPNATSGARSTPPPTRAEVRTLMGLLHERVGEHHAAYQCYRLALLLDRHDPVAGDGLRRYCQRFGFDPGNKAINPAVGDPA